MGLGLQDRQSIVCNRRCPQTCSHY